MAVKKGSVTGEAIVDGFRRIFRVSNDSDVAIKLGVTSGAISQWRQLKTITARQIIGLVLKSQEAAVRQVEKAGIQPVVEFFPLNKKRVGKGNNFEMFDDHAGSQEPHPYLSGLKAELESHHGVYVFFDSSGRAIYAGKARIQNLWKEMNLVFNRNRKDLQTIKRVKHPSIKSTYKTSDEKSRQIIGVSIPLHELAAYVSAYAVKDGLISVVEAMLVRSFANDLLNKRMERFGGSKKATKKKQTLPKRKSP
ncbi:MAG: hypothetical protein POH28_06110 [Acidocella sp.]|nr:hypothetical protein [Acidocella sp.]